MPQDRDKWLASVYMGMNIWVNKMAKIYTLAIQLLASQQKFCAISYKTECFIVTAVRNLSHTLSA
jgi:hypothetical protein